MKIICTLLVFAVFLFLGKVLAVVEPVYFDFKLRNVTLTKENLSEVSFNYDIPMDVDKDRFKVKPRTNNGIISVLDNDNWITGGAFWTNAPSLSKNKQIKLKGNFYKTKVWFEILDTQTGNIYKTPKHFILTRNWFKNYIETLNKSILNYGEMIK